MYEVQLSATQPPKLAYAVYPALSGVVVKLRPEVENWLNENIQHRWIWQ